MNNILSERARNNMTQSYVAYEVGVSRKTMGKYETNEGFASMRCGTALKLAELFDCSLDWLAGKTRVRRSFGGDD